MIQMQTYLNVADNSGAKKVMCICRKKQKVSLGDIIKVVVKEAVAQNRENNNMVKKSEIFDAVIVRMKFPKTRSNGINIRFDDNAVILLQKDGNPRGTRVFGPIAEEVRTKGFSKILSLASHIV